MNNTTGTVPVPLTVFGGAVTEMAPEDLPEGASPFNQDVDYVPGATFTRGGRQSVYTFAGLFAEDLAGFAVSIPGLSAPNEAPWGAPLNATLNTPGIYSGVTLNAPAGSPFGGFTIDQSISNSGSGTSTLATGTPARSGEVALYVGCNGGFVSDLGPIVPGAGWSLLDTLEAGATTIYTKFLPDTSLVSETQSITPVAADWVTALVFFGSSSGLSLGFVQQISAAGGPIGSGTYSATFGAPITSGNGILLILAAIATPGAISGVSATDSKGNVYSLVTSVTGPGSNASVVLLWAPGAVAGTTTYHFTFTGSVTATIRGYEVSGVGSLNATPAQSQILQATNFAFNIPVNETILGAQLEVSGHQTTQPIDAILTGNLLQPNGVPGFKKISGQLPLSDAQAVIGTAAEGWGLAMTPAMVNDPSFGAQIVASAIGGELQGFSIYAIKLKIWTSPAPPANFNWIKTYEQTSGQIDTLALDANGILWDENVTSNPTVFNSIYTGILPGSYAKSVTFDNIEYIALSNLVNGTDIPRQWTGAWLDRVSQVGPGGPPSVSVTATTYNIVASPLGITQFAASSDPEQPGKLSAILWSSGPGSMTPGNVITIYYARVTLGLAVPDPHLVIGQGVQLAGIGPFTSGPLNGNYIITSLGQGIPPFPGDVKPRFYFTVQATAINGQIASGAVGSGPAGTYQATVATLTTTTPLPNTNVGSQITVSGAGVAGWNAVWTITATPNAAQLAITSTSLSANVATYTFTLISGTTPTVGQQITIIGCLNGPQVGGTSIFNVVNGLIASISPGQFTINVTGPNVTPAAESGNGNINGTIFQFDPGISLAGQTIINPIFGNSGGGTVIIAGAGFGAGVRMAVVFFKTRNNALTPCSFPVTFTTPSGTSSVAFGNIPIGPPDVVARIIGMTGANGGNFFWIPQPVTVQVSGQSVTYTSTVINDNTSTTAVFAFTDAVLLASTAMDIQGNNLFSQIELGSCRGFLTYANRLIAWGEQNKIQNLLNLSMDGGSQQNSVGTPYPLGWTIDPVNGSGGILQVSPVFGNSYYIHNTTGGPQALYGMIEQSAFQDAYKVPIVLPATTYSVRVTARSPSGTVSGTLMVDLFSPLQNKIFGSFAVNLAAMTSNMQIFTGTMLTQAFAVIPADLLLRIYAANIPNNGDVEIDRVEPFPTLQPVLSTQLRASYAGNQEAFDNVTGGFGPNQNQQPINGAFTMYDTLYALKEKSLYSTSDNGVTEPNQWTWREVSQKTGTIGELSFDVGESWMLTACRPGVYFFEGGEPIKVSQEIQSVWDLINWQAGPTVWVRNDEQLKRFTIGVPIPTPNVFMPEFPSNPNPTSPNVILMCSYRELNTGVELAHTGPIRSTFSGRLMSPEPARKWSFWNIACPYADFIDRANNQWPEFFCNGYQNSKIYQLSSAELDDDGATINSFYVTYGFVKPEMQDAKGLGLFRMELDYFTALLTGSGAVLVQVYPESVQNLLPYQLAPIALQSFSQGDDEVAVNITGNRFFLRIGSNALGSSFRLSKMVVALTQDQWSPVRGTAVGNA
jgi:hypothetical protein